jgi:diacylglycerol O-acyltransferase / wax synthase
VSVDHEPALTALDATFLELEEADDAAHMHIGAVLVLEASPSGGAPPLQLVREAISRRVDRLPRFRQRLSEQRTGGLSWPRWIEDAGFEIRNHVRAAGLPAERDLEELRRWAGDYFSIRLDRSRPLWELVVVELADGRWALVSKTHHCLVDGVGSVDAAEVLLDLERDPQEPDGASKGSPPPERAPTRDDARARPLPLRLAGSALHLGGRALSSAGSLLQGSVSAAGGLGDPHRLAEALRQSKAVAELLIRDEVVAAPKVSLNEPIGAHRRLGVVQVPLEDLKRIKRDLGGTVNDVVLAATAAGMRALLLSRGEEPPAQGLRAMVPVNVRPVGDGLGLGNRISSLFVHLPVAETDPLVRYREQMEEAESLKSGDQALGSRAMIEVAALAPPALHSFIARSLFATRLFNVTITNVPGPQQPLYALGSRVLEAWPIVPLAAEHALGVAVLSYDGDVFFCINADHDSVPDLEVLREGIAEELRLLLAEAGVPGTADT